jgi:hypothetical protein
MLRMCEHCELPVRTPDFEHHFESFRHSSRGNARNKKPEFNVEGYDVDQLRANKKPRLCASEPGGG